jgi:hypothetical protein
MSTPTSSFPTPTHFYLNIPLYETVKVEEGQELKGLLVEYFNGSMDSYCPKCGSHSIFNRNSSQTSWDVKEWIKDHSFSVTFKCSRDRKHELYFLFQLESRILQKIGQYPSIASLNLFDVKKYSNALSKRLFQEFTRSIGLAAHGVGVGSFVYLRRIFEHLIEEAHAVAISSNEWNEETFQKYRMSDRIQILSKWLPDFLVQNKGMYGILSKGIHELTEEECLAAFPILKVGIEIILDAKLHEIDRKKKLEEAQRAIQALSSSSGA